MTTCDFSPDLRVILDPRPFRSLPGMDLVQINGEYAPFEPGVIVAVLSNQSFLAPVLAAYKLRLRRDLSGGGTAETRRFYALEDELDDRPPDTAALARFTDSVARKGRYRLFTNAGANTFLKTIRMMEGFPVNGVRSAELNLNVAANPGDWGPIAAP